MSIPLPAFRDPSVRGRGPEHVRAVYGLPDRLPENVVPHPDLVALYGDLWSELPDAEVVPFEDLERRRDRVTGK
jgi:hypothetical protein